jgi:hypothetical protein
MNQRFIKGNPTKMNEISIIYPSKEGKKKKILEKENEQKIYEIQSCFGTTD